MTALAASPVRKIPAVRIAALLLGGALVFLLALALLGGFYQLLHAGRVLPGVRVAGVELSGLTRSEAALALNQRLTYPVSGQVLLRDGERVWVATPAQLGMVFDVDGTVRAAYRVGRQSGPFGNLAGQIRALKDGVDIQPVVILDQGITYAYLQDLSRQVDRPVMDADLHLEGSTVVYSPAQNGHTLDVDASLVALVAQLQTFRDGEVPLVTREETPRVLDATAQAEMLRQFLSTPLTLSIAEPQPGDPGPWQVDVSSLASLVRIASVPAEGGTVIQVTLEAGALQPLLTEIAAQVDRKPANARFVFNDETRELTLIQSGVNGRRLDQAAALEAIQSALQNGGHSAALPVVIQAPQVGDDATAASLGITGLVSSQISYFRGSGAERMQNIQIAGSSYHGLLIAPGETFSMGDALGDVSLENGYEEAMIIYNGRTIKGVGGGVCQVSTTLFRTAFFGGYPILERTPHAYRVYYYEQTAGGYDSNLAGLDATVYFPLVDMKFTNDRSSWLLMEVYVNKSAQRITWKFYSNEDGRQVEWSTTGLLNIIPAPEPLLQESPDIARDEMKQVDWQADGADIAVRRTVSLNGTTLFSDFFPTIYQPWQAICEYGSGTEDPEALAEKLNLCQ